MLQATLAEAVRRFGARPAFVSLDVSLGASDAAGPALTYAGLDQLSDEVAGGLAARGVRAGDVVSLALPTSLEYPVCYLAAAKLGAVTAGLNLRLPPVQLRTLIEISGARLVITTVDGLDTGPTEAVLLRPGRWAPLRVPDWAPPRLAEDPDAPVAIVFTSGTTGTPKGALFCDRQLSAIRDIDVGPAWGGGGTSLAATSMAHLGFMTKLPGAVQAGGVSYLTPRWDAALALRLAEQLRLSTLAGVPTQLAMLLALPELASRDLTSVRQVLIGGGPATPALVRAARTAFGVPVCTRYSCTEAGIGCATRPGDPQEDAEETVGRPQPGVELS
ncbi:MAG: class I adenylate-forming enzyme family protein, partial [Mycobacteriales bacterium]